MGKIIIVIVLSALCSVLVFLVLMPPRVTRGSGSDVGDIVALGSRSEFDPNDSRNAVLATHLQTVRSRIQLWTFEHLDLLPGNTPGVSLQDQLTARTNTDGTLNPSGVFDPYLFEFPKNPFTGTNTVNTDSPSNAWTYDAVTGEFRADNAPSFDF